VVFFEHWLPPPPHRIPKPGIAQLWALVCDAVLLKISHSIADGRDISSVLVGYFQLG
ncbi:uncharacterized protein METZ01_LOCUS470565, partial [marine metagenome]